MVDSRFYKTYVKSIKLSQIAKLIDVEIDDSNYQECLIYGISTLESANGNNLSFLSNQKYLEDFNNTKAAACIVPYEFKPKVSNNVILLRSKNPYFSYGKAIALFYKANYDLHPKIMKSAYIESSATIGKNCFIGHNVVIEDNVAIGDDCIIESGAVIKQGVIIGSRTKIESSATISYSIIGDDCIIFAGARIGQDGFGFSTHQGMHNKVFHTGRVLIGNNVEIGANTTIDRGSTDDTIIEDLCRIDNLVQIAHNVKIGKGTVIAGQVGIAGSTKIGSYCMIGGQVGFAGHLKVGSFVQIAGGSGVGANVDEKSVIGGYPAVKIKDWHRQNIIMKHLINKNKNATS